MAIDLKKIERHFAEVRKNHPGPFPLRIVYWKSKKFWLGRFVEHPDIMTQGRTLKELEENLKDAYREMTAEGIPEDHYYKEVLV